jgi:hypothetical protein
MEAKDAHPKKNERDEHLDTSREFSTSDDLSELNTGTSEVEETQATSGSVSDSEEDVTISSELNDQFSNSDSFEQELALSEDFSDNAQAAVLRNDEDVQNFSNNATQEAVDEDNKLSPNSGSLSEEPESDGNADEFDNFQNQETANFEYKEEGQNDDFGEFGDFDGSGHISNADDDFGDFGDFDEVSEVKNSIETQPEDIHLDGIDDYVSIPAQCELCHRRYLIQLSLIPINIAAITAG